MTDFVEDQIALLDPAVDINTRPSSGPGTIPEVSWWGADRINYDRSALGSLRAAMYNGRGFIMRALSSLLTTTSGQVSIGSIGGQLYKNENGGSDVMVGRMESLSRAATVGAYAPPVKADTVIEITMDADLTLNNPVVTGSALSQKSGCHLILAFKQSSTGNFKVTWGGNYRCNFIQPKQGPNQTSTVHLLQRADGNWQLVSHDAINIRREIHVEDFGLPFDGTSDCSPATQAAINFAIYNGNVESDPSPNIQAIVMPVGFFNYDTALQLGWANVPTWVTLEFRGTKMGTRDATTIGGTVMKFRFSNQPGIAVNSARSARVKNIAMVSTLYPWIANNWLGQNASLGEHDPLVDDRNPDNWWDPGLSAVGTGGDSRYAPHAGIVVDGYVVDPTIAHPTTSKYPDITSFPPQSGISTTYGRAFSSEVLIEDVYFYGWNVGGSVAPDGHDGNGDFVKFSRCAFDSCKWGISIGQTQSRNVDIQNCQFVFTYANITTCRHGVANGKLGGTITDMSMSSSMVVLDLGSASVFGPLEFNNFYGEAMYRIGDFNFATSSENGVVFNGGQFSFGAQDASLNTSRGVPGSIFSGGRNGLNPNDIGGFGNVLFSECSFFNFPSVLYFGVSGAKFKRCQFGSDQLGFISPTYDYQALGQNFTQGGVVSGRFDPVCKDNTFLAWNVGSLSTGNLVRDNPTGRNIGTSVYARQVSPLNGANTENFDNPLKAPNAWDKTDTGTFTSIALSGLEVTLTFASLSEWAAIKWGMMPGDVWLDYNSGTVFYVRSTTLGSGATVIGVAQNNYKKVSGVLTVQNFDPSHGIIYAYTSRFYLNSTPIRGDLSSFSPTISNIQREDGFTSGVIDAQAGDWFWMDPQIEKWGAQTDLKIGAVDGSAHTITLTGGSVFLEAITRKRLAWFIRKPPDNV